MAYDPTMGRGMSGGQPGMARGGAQRQQPMGRPAPPPPMGGGMGRSAPTVGQSLASQVGGMQAARPPQNRGEDDFLVNLGFGALKDAYQRELQSRSRVPGTNAPPLPGQMERFQRGNRVPRYGAPPMRGGGGMRPRPPMGGGGGMRPRPPMMGGGMRPRPPMGGGMMQRPMMQPQMGYQQPMMQQPMMAPPPPPVAYGGFGAQAPPSGYYNPYMF